MGYFFKIKRLLLGNPLHISQLSHEKISKWKALAVLSSDALSSVAYATEEILIALCAFSTLAAPYSMVISFFIAALLLVITVSYLQTISSYPDGGGAYIVAKENLGVTAGLVAGAALLIDYVLTVAVSASAGVENIASAFHFLWPHKESLGVAFIVIIMLLNLRGIRESSSIFALPTYFFIFSVIILLTKGLWQIFLSNADMNHPISSTPLSASPLPIEVPIFILLKAFSSGCSALTGVEAISNGIPIFKQPSQRNAKITLIWMSSILGFFFLGISFLSYKLGIIPDEKKTVISLLSESVFGHSLFFYFTQISTALILLLAANTSYADFPRLASLLAKDRFMPRQLSSLGDKLVFSNGIIGLSLCAIALIIFYGGETHHLIPLYAVGVFLSFTLSQTGMIVHHFKFRERGWKLALIINFLGALSTAIVLLVIGATKFTHGAWIVIILIPLFVIIFYKINRHYLLLAKQLSIKPTDKIKSTKTINHRAVILVSGVHRGILQAVAYSQTIAKDVEALYVELDAEKTPLIVNEWKELSLNIPLKILLSPFRSLNEPILNYIDELLLDENLDFITIVIPEFVTAKWWENFLHNHSALFIKTALMFKRRIVIVSVKHHLKR